MRQMEEAGCRVVLFHEKAFRNIGVLNDRDHRKLVVIDGREAFVGGHCIVDSWLGDAQDSEHFGDISLRLCGPIVNSVQSAFSENWAGETGELFLGDDVFPTLEPAGDVLIHAAYAKPEGSAPAVKILHHTAICLARKRIWIQNPYFIPEPEAIDAFGEAVSRGVDVRVMMPSTGGSDNPMVQHAGHRNFEKLLRCGVRLFEYPHTLLHQKVMTIDGVWSAVGSSNFDDRSFETNDEITLGIRDPATAQRLDAVFEKYVSHCKEIELEAWRKRGLWHKLKDNAFYTTEIGVDPPTLSNSRSCKNLKSFAWSSFERSPISSKKIVPALRHFDLALLTPHSAGECSRFVAEQLAFQEFLGKPDGIDRDERSVRLSLQLWIDRAKTSFPVPLSPRSKTVALLAAVLRANSTACFILALSPIIKR